MPELPAFCDNCGTVFSSGIFVNNAANITFTGNRSGPCPRCGSMGQIPDGVFNFIGNTIEILSAPQRTVDELNRLAQIIREAHMQKHSSEAVAQRIQEELPSLASLAGLLPRNRVELYGFLTLIITVVILIVQLLQGQQQPTKVTVNQVITQLYIDSHDSH